jgi:hypothetical protein
MIYSVELVPRPENTTMLRTSIEQTINGKAGQGWEFVSMHETITTEAPGCLGGLLGRGAASVANFVLIFRK